MCVLSQILHISMRSCADFENENLLNLHKVSANLPWVPPANTIILPLEKKLSGSAHV